MKKVISLLLVFVIAMSFAACSGSNDHTTTEPPTINAEELKKNWKQGELVFANAKKVAIPCDVNEIVEASELELYNSSNIEKITLAPEEHQTIYLVNDNTRIEIKCKNTTDADVNIMESTVVKYNLTNLKPGNRKIKFAGGLTANVVRSDVETALGIPDGANSDSPIYIYSGRNNKNKKVELRIAFNSNNGVNSVAYEINM